MAEEIELMIKDFRFVAHWSFKNGAQRIDKGEIVWPNNILHGKTIVRIIDTPKRGGSYGKGEASYMLDEESAPEFKTIDAFMEHYTPNVVELRGGGRGRKLKKPL